MKIKLTFLLSVIITFGTFLGYSNSVLAAKTKSFSVGGISCSGNSAGQIAKNWDAWGGYYYVGDAWGSTSCTGTAETIKATNYLYVDGIFYDSVSDTTTNEKSAFADSHDSSDPGVYQSETYHSITKSGKTVAGWTDFSF